MPTTSSVELAPGCLLDRVRVPDVQVLVLGPVLVHEHRAVGEVGERAAHEVDAQERRVAGLDPGDPEEVAVPLALGPPLPHDAVDAGHLGHPVAMLGENGSPNTLLTTKSPMKFSSIAWSTLALAESPRIAIVQPRASPIIRAEAVAVVRRGLRSEFCPARLPTLPKIRRYAAWAAREERPADHRAHRRHAQQHDEHPAAEHPAARGDVGEQPDAHGRGARDDREHAEHQAPVDGRLRERDVVAQRLHGRDPGGTPRRQPGRSHRDDHTDDVAGEHGPRREDQGLAGEVEAEVREQGADAHRQQHTEAEAERRAHQADDERLEQHRPGDLSLGRAERAQQRQLAAALGDQDREGVDDQERPDDQGDPGEDQQEGTQEADRVEKVGRRLVGRVVTGDGLQASR